MLQINQTMIQLITTYQTFSMKTINDELLISYIVNHGIQQQFESFLKEVRLGTYPSPQSMTLEDVKTLCRKINPKEAKNFTIQQSQEPPSVLSWKKGELKLFLWVLVYYSYTIGKKIQEFKENQYHFLELIFMMRNRLRLNYEINCLFPPKCGYKTLWKIEQIDIFLEVINRYENRSNKFQWKLISYEIFTLSQGNFFKTNSQCRQRWLNHLNPQITKKGWSRQEDYILMKTVQDQGAKWSEVAKTFQGTRTAHMVKNRYLALIHKWKKDVRSKKTNEQIRQKIMRTIQRNIQRKKKKKGDNPNNNIKQIINEDYNERSIIIQEREGAEQQQSISEEVPQQQVKVQQYLKKVEDIQILPNFFCECFHTSYPEECLKDILEDITDKLGCGQAACYDMLFESEQKELFLEE